MDGIVGTGICGVQMHCGLAERRDICAEAQAVRVQKRIKRRRYPVHMVMIFANPKAAWANQFGMELPRHRSELFSCRVAATEARLVGKEDGRRRWDEERGANKRGRATEVDMICSVLTQPRM